MSQPTIRQPHNVIARIAYWPERNNSDSIGEVASGMMPARKDVEIHEMTLYDVRYIVNDFTLDQNGFQLWTLPRMPQYTKDDQEIEAKQYPEIAEAIKRATGGSKVRIFSHIIRDKFPSQAQSPKPSLNASENYTSRSPAICPHADFDLATCPSFFSGGGRPELARYIASGRRWQIIGAWRPLKTVYRNPLTLCDARSVSESEFVKVERDMRGRAGAYSVLRHSEDHLWYYVCEQRPDEAWLLKHFDSLQAEGNVRRCVHTSFEMPGTWSLPPRESVEFRALVFY